MSVVDGKKILFAGELSPAMALLKNQLDQEQAFTDCDSCVHLGANAESITADLLILNQESQDPSCTALLSTLQSSTKTKYMPVLTCVPNIDTRINAALMRGAADYFTPTEDVDSVVQKVKSNFGMPSTYAGVSAVDLSERAVLPTDDITRVYVVEDDSLLRTLLSTKFDMSHVAYDFSSDGLDVEDKIRTFKPSVILLDIMIGGVNGLDILEALKQSEDLRNIPVVVFSNQDSHEERERAAQLGASEYLVKVTTNLSDLIKLLRSLA